jgi:hypothetical protein
MDVVHNNTRRTPTRMSSLHVQFYVSRDVYRKTYYYCCTYILCECWPFLHA